MSDDASSAFLQSGGDDHVLADDNARFAAAQELEQQAELGASAKADGFNITDVFENVQNRSLRWLYRLPVNMATGTWRALGNTIETAADFASDAVEANVNDLAGRAKANKGRTDSSGKPVEPIDIPTLSQAYPELMSSFYGVADALERNNRVEDDITAGMTQFALPFMGWLKAFGTANAATKIGTIAKAAAAEGVTAGSAFAPYDARFADLVQMGRDLDGRFGDLLRNLSPDGSLTARYIDYMTNRANEGPWEGRWKNAVDSLTTTAAIAGFVKAAGHMYRKTRKALAKKSQKLEEGEAGA